MRPSLVRSFLVVGNARAVGKTLVTCATAQWLCEGGVQAIAMKPVSVADQRDAHGWRSSELEQLAAAGAFGLPARVLSPFLLPRGQGATERSCPRTAMDAVVDSYRVLSTWSDVVVIEGADDVCQDLGVAVDSACLACELGLPAVLVVALEAGCVASAQARIAALTARGVECAGWIANEPRAGERNAQGLLADLTATLPAPCLGAIPWLAHCTPTLAARSIELERMQFALAG